MATIKLKKSTKRSDPSRPPVRGGNRGAQPRPTLGQAQAQRVERDARYNRDAQPQGGGGGQGFDDRRGQRPQGNMGFGGGRDPRASASNFERPQERPANRAFDSRSDRAAPAHDNRPAPVAAGMGQKFDEKRFYEERNRAPRVVESQAPEQRYDERRPSAARSDDRGSYGQRSFQPRRDERPPTDNRAFEQRPFQPRGDERARSFEQGPAQPRFANDRGRGQEFAAQRPAPRFENHREEPRRFEPRRFDERAAARPEFGRRDEAPRHERGELEPRGAAQEQHAPGAVRLSKRMSELGLASRREADEWIEKGWIRVDGKVVARLGIRVLPEQQITIDPRAKHEQAARVTVLLNKPVGYVSGQAEDGYEPAVVLFTGENHWSGDPSGIAHDRLHLKYLAPAGRLDIESVGLLVLTQDGRVARQLIGEDSDVEKEYLVRVEYRGKDADFSDETSDAENEMPADAASDADGDQAETSDVENPAGPTARDSLPEADLALLNHGLELDGEALIPARVEWLNDDQLRFVLREGKKRQIRRMCQAVGLHVTGLKRVRIGKVMLGDLPTGQWRYLAPGESFV